MAVDAGGHPRVRRRVAGFTIVEMLFIMILMGIVMVLLYTVFGGTAIRVIGVAKRADGQEAVRILLHRIRQELKSAVGLVDIQNNGRSLIIPLEDRTRPPDDLRRFYFSQYDFDAEHKEIHYQKLNRDRGGPLESRIWLGGQTHVLDFRAFSTSDNERILFQYYRVVVEIDHFDIKLKPNKTKEELEAEGGTVTDPTKINPRDVVHSTATVYPRRVNMELRIEVPQEGGTL
ncbi:MAG: type II secretion system protein [Candidatus Wallbacteria bacterium]|nr:type II secretion system protein [Candidatus Wallbacteria bacterium]